MSQRTRSALRVVFSVVVTVAVWVEAIQIGDISSWVCAVLCALLWVLLGAWLLSKRR